MEADWLGLRGQVAVVTGAASGIGAAVARTLAHVGARVALLDRNGEGTEAMALEINRSIDEMGGPRKAPENIATGFECDVGSEASVQATAARVAAEVGPVSVLVNNAGILRPGALAEVSLEHWNQLLAVNLTGYLLCARAFSAPMRAAGRGSIVHVASISGFFPQTASGAYSASKAGILLMSKQMAVEWGPLGVRSNCVCPGMIRTALSAKFYEEPGFEAKRAAMTASRRVGEPEDIANVAVFLASPRAAYVNGAELLVDGGMSNMLMDMVPRPGFNQTSKA